MIRFPIVFLFLGACTGNPDCGDECDGSVGHDGDCADCPDDTGDPPLGSATVTMDVYRLGEIEDCMVHMVGGTVGEYIEESGEAFEVEAPVTYSAKAGGADRTLNDLFGFPIHISQDGEYWAAPNQSVELVDKQVYEGSFDLFNLFEPGSYACTRDVYRYDESASDKKGDLWQSFNDDAQNISVTQDGRVIPTDRPGLSTFEDDDYLLAEDDQLTLVEVGSANGLYVSMSNIDVQWFDLTVVQPNISVSDIACYLQ